MAMPDPVPQVATDDDDVAHHRMGKSDDLCPHAEAASPEQMPEAPDQQLAIPVYYPRDDVMQGVPDSTPVKRPATTTVEQLRSDTLGPVEMEPGTMNLAWVGVHNGQFLLDIGRQQDDPEMLAHVAELPHDTNTDEGYAWRDELDEGEHTLDPSQKDKDTAKAMGGPSGVNHGGEKS